MYGREPDWDAMANQRLYAYLDSCDPRCEDCECEEGETPEMICRTCLADDDAHAPDEDCEKVPCECKCHNGPFEPDPDRDRDEPDDIPDYWDAPDYNAAEQEEHH